MINVTNHTDMPTPVLRALANWAVLEIYGPDESPVERDLAAPTEIRFRKSRAHKEPRVGGENLSNIGEMAKALGVDRKRIRRALQWQAPTPKSIHGRYNVYEMRAFLIRVYPYMPFKTLPEAPANAPARRLTIYSVPIDGNSAVETYFPLVLDIGVGLAKYFGGPKLPVGDMAEWRQPIGLKWKQQAPTLLKLWFRKCPGVDPVTGRKDPVAEIESEVDVWVGKTKRAVKQLQKWTRRLRAAKLAARQQKLNRAASPETEGAL